MKGSIDMKYSVEFSCGHTETVTLFGKNEERERKLWWYRERGVCSACKQAAYEEELKELNEEAARNNWPEIRGYGSFKAKKLRRQYLKAAENLLQDPKMQKNENNVQLLTLAISLATKHTDANYWLDMSCEESFLRNTRDEALSYLLSTNEGEKECGSTPENAEHGSVAEKAKEEEQSGTLTPTGGKDFQGTVVIKFESGENGKGTIRAYYEKNDAFMSVVKGLDYKWGATHRAWYFAVTEVTGTAESRISELANKLLSKGFSVIVPKFAEEAVISGTYEPRCTKWIDDKDGKFRISWSRSDPSADTMYKRARSLPNAKWQDGGIIVPVTSYDEVKDFGKMYDFSFTPEAMKLYDEQLNKLMKVAHHKVEETNNISDPLNDKLQKIDEDIPEDLIDE